MSNGSGVVFVGASHSVGASGSFLMAGGGRFAIPAAVDASVAAGPTIMRPARRVGGYDRAPTGDSFARGQLLGEYCDTFQGDDEFGVALAKSGNGFDCFLLRVGGSKFVSMEAHGTRSSYLGFSVLLVGSGKVNLELWPGFVGFRLPLPVAAIVRKDGSLEEDLICNREDLGRGVWCVAGGGVVDGIFYLSEEGFDGQVDVVSRFHMGIVGLHIGGCDVGVGLIQMGEFVQRRACCKTDEGKTEGLEVNGIDSSDHECRDGLLHILVGVEDGLFFLEDLTNIFDFWCLGIGMENRSRARVDGSHKREGREGIVDRLSDGDSEMSELTVAEV